MYSIFQNLNLVINRRVTKTVLYSKNAPPPPPSVKFLRGYIYFLALFMGDNIFHVICILERIICYKNPPTDKSGGGGGGRKF